MIAKFKYMNEEQLKRYEGVCNIIDQKFYDLISLKKSEIRIYDNEIRETELGTTSYIETKLFLLKAKYGITFEIGYDYLEHCYRIRLKEYRRSYGIRESQKRIGKFIKTKK